MDAQTSSGAGFENYIDLTDAIGAAAAKPVEATPPSDNPYSTYQDLTQPTQAPVAQQEAPPKDASPYSGYVDLTQPQDASSAAAPEEQKGVELADYSKSLWAGLAGLSAAGQSGLAHLARFIKDDEEAKKLEQRATTYRGYAEDTVSKMSPEAKSAIESSVTSGDFWKRPVLAASLKSMNMTPALAMAALPMGLLAEVGVGAAGVTGAGFATGAGMGVGSYADAVASKVDKATDDTLQKQSDFYRDLRAGGKSEEDARHQFKTWLTSDGAALVNGVIGGVTNVVGLPSVVARTPLGRVTADAALERFGGDALRNTLASAGAEAVQAAAPAAVQAGVENVTEQQAGVQAGLQQKIDPVQVAAAVADSAAMSALPGAALGGARGYKSGINVRGDIAREIAGAIDGSSSTPPQTSRASAVEVVDGPNAAERAALSSETEDWGRGPTAGRGPVDAGENVSETPETLAEQARAVSEGHRPAIIYPIGTRAPATPEGMVRVTIDGNRFDYDPMKTSPEELRKRLRDDTIGEMLGYGPMSKADVIKAVRRGEKPLTVTETTPDGVEAKSALTTESALPDTLAAVHSGAAPENTVEVKPVTAADQIVQQRRSGAGFVESIKERARAAGEGVAGAVRSAKANVGNAARFVRDKTAFRHILASDIDHLLTTTSQPLPYRLGAEHRLAREIDRERRAMSQTSRDMEEQLGGVASTNALSKWKSDPNWGDAMDLLHTARRLNVNLFTDNVHLGKDSAGYWRSRAREQGLKDRWTELEAANPEMMADLKEGLVTLERYHGERSKAKIRALLEGTNIEDKEGFADRFYNDKLTPQDEAFLGSTDRAPAEYGKVSELLSALRDAKALSKIEGTYVPLSRPKNASHVVTAKVSINNLPEGARLIPNTNIVEFSQQPGETAASLRRRTKDFVENGPYEIDDVKSTFLDEDGQPIERQQEGTNAYHVEVRDKQVEFAGSEGKAREIARRLEKDGGYEDISVGPKKPTTFEGAGVGPLTPLMENLERRLRSQEKFKSLSLDEQEALVDALHESTLRLRAGTSIRLNDLKARNVLGHNLDLPENAAHIYQKSALDIARSTHIPRVEKMMGELEKAVEEKKGTPDYNRARELFDEFKSRVFDLTEDGAKRGNDSKYMDWVRAGSRRATQLSALKNLFGVSFNAINATDAHMAAGPTLAARYGAGPTNVLMGNAYKIIGAPSAVGHGTVRTLKALAGDKSNFDYIDHFKENIPANKRAELGRVLDYMRENGAITGQAELNYSEHLGSGDVTPVGKTIDWLDHSSRQVGNAIDSVNRAVVALTTYQAEKRLLERERKAGRVRMDDAQIKERAMQVAYETTINTLGDFTRANAAPALNMPVAEWAAQFKRYGLKQAHLIGRMMAESVRGNPTAIKALGYTMGVQILMTGIAGLPVGPVKTALWAYKNAVGEDYTESDYQRDMREIAKHLVHTIRPEIKNDHAAIEALSNGIWRALGVEVSKRMSLSNLFLDDMPRLGKNGNFSEWLGNKIVGAPGSTLGEMFKSATALAKDPSVKHAAEAVPLRFVQDFTKAISGYNEGKKTASGYQKQEAYTPYEAVVKGMGFKPSREADIEARARAFDEAKSRRAAFRKDINQRWLEADPDTRSKIIKEISDHNANLEDGEERVKISELNNYVRRHRQKDHKTYLGREYNKKKDRALRNTLEGLYGSDQ